ncbi:FAD-dependent oxidoreductase [Chloroflexota bacterium]
MTSKTDLTNLGEVVETDVLIIGGGIAGLTAAIKANQTRPEVSVLVVDKATPGYAGQGPRTGGYSSVVPEELVEDWLKRMVGMGGYLNDQELTYTFGKEISKIHRELADLGAPYIRDEKGELLMEQLNAKNPVSPYCAIWEVPPEFMQFLKGKARSEGTRILKRTMLVSLLTEGERVVGAVGFSIDSGQFYILKAKATILANGGCMYRYRSWFRNNNGIGASMAYNVGAEMRNAEFACTVGCVTQVGLMGAHHSYQDVENALGENIGERYGITPVERWNYHIMFPLVWKEIQEGRGPISSIQSVPEQTRTGGSPKRVQEFWPRIREKLGQTHGTRVEMVLAQSNRQGPIRVDSHFRATIPGLWAVGGTSFGGSGYFGAQSPGMAAGGFGIGFAQFSGYRSGLDAAEFASEAAATKIDSAEVSKLKKQIYAPLERKQGFDPNDAIYQVQETIEPVKYNVYKSEERMQEALAKVEEVKEKLPTLWAKDLHDLVKAHESASMALCAEMTYRPALMRRESRSTFLREDYPERDDQNWLKWIILQKEKEEMKLRTEPVPFDKYKVKPPKEA